MNTSLNRLNAVTAFATSTLLCMVAIIALISYPTHHPSGAGVEVQTLQVVSGRAQWHLDRRVQDYVKVVFDIDADFSNLFNWNTKQVFLSVVAEYDSKAHARNQVVVWDRIIREKGDAHVKLHEGMNKYGFREVSKSFSNITTATFFLKWNVMPKVGLLAYGDEAQTGSIDVPKKLLAAVGEARIKTEKMWI
ncbi:hypothetical protein CBS101457_000569 [Exobasidium rhododendri]|nr:hypothetical protein CBS101457_000569 [Exobasidium rhododendri]